METLCADLVLYFYIIFPYLEKGAWDLLDLSDKMSLILGWLFLFENFKISSSIAQFELTEVGYCLQCAQCSSKCQTFLITI